MTVDILIVGAGVVGCAIARALSRYNVSILVVDQALDVAEGASKANSGIVHAGFDAVPGTLKAKLNIRGAQMYPDLCKELGVPYKKNGALILGFREEDRKTIETLLAQGEANGVKNLRILERDDILQMEPNANPAVVCALDVPESGITSPYEMTYALADHAAINGVQFSLGTGVSSVKNAEGVWLTETNKGTIESRVIINCAGTDSARLHNMMNGDAAQIINRRGQYYILDHQDVMPFSHAMFQCPTKMGKGVLVSPTVHGNILLGPTAEDISDPSDVDTTMEGLADVLKACALTWPNVSIRTTVTSFSGIRAHEAKGDFIVGSVKGCAHAYEAVGIESPGLSAAPAIAEKLEQIICKSEGLYKKNEWKTLPKREKPFNEMNSEERIVAVAANPLHGNIICRCEVVTEAEIRAAIRRPMGATSVDGVKRRTRAGMGRCQGGFCSPRVVEILSEELHLPMTEIRKGCAGSEMLVGTVQEALEAVKE